MRIVRVCAGVVALMALSCGAVLGISLCDYQAPDTSLIDVGVSFSYQFFDDANTAAIDVSTGRIDFSFDRLRDTESFGFIAQLDGKIGLTNFLPSSWLGEGITSFRYYVSRELPLFGFGGIRGIATTGQTQLGLEISSGFGFGRFHDVTPLAKAMNISRNLRDSKTISTVLSDSMLTKIAQTIGGLGAFETIADAVAVIEASIETATGVQLGTRSLLMIEDVIQGNELQRFCGFSAQAGLGYELLDPYGGSPGFIVVLSSDMAFAPDPSTQLEGHLSFSGPFDLANENTLTGSFSYEIVVTDSSAVEASYSFQRTKPAGQAAVASHVISGDVVFQVAAVDVLLSLTIWHNTGDADWSIEFSILAALDLL